MRTLHFELITGNLYFDVAVPFTADTYHRVLARPDTRNIRITQDRMVGAARNTPVVTAVGVAS